MAKVEPTVYLVGAGPGDPSLITVAGADVLRRAAVVVYDYLANPDLLRLAPPGAELLYVGKSGNQHTKTQDEINAILVEKARERGTVVRLKGGDPYVFGRGGEEAEYLRANSIPFVEIPGITAGIAAPAYAGIPVTHRDFTSTITLVTGHEREDTPGAKAESEDTRVNYAALAQLNGTLVFYMGVKSLPSITQKLLAGGMDRQTPAAVVRWGTRADQRTVTGTVSTIVDVVQKAGIKAPAITIVGKVVSLRENLNWFERRPLFGKRILVTRTRQQASELSAKLAALGAQVVEAPTIDIASPAEDEWPEIDKILMHIPAYDWVVFTSANGVRATWDRLRHLTFDARHFGANNVAAIGDATARELAAIGIVPDLIPEKFVGEELAAALKTHIGASEMASKRFLLLRADIARPVLREELEKMGAQVEDVAIYDTIRPASLPEEVITALNAAEADRPHLVTFTSASTANNLWDLLTPEQRQAVAKMQRASIGPITTAALNKLGNGEWKPTIEATTHNIEGLVEAITRAGENAS
jgi:uroporphyrinogen III methyltransferase / synthase